MKTMMAHRATQRDAEFCGKRRGSDSTSRVWPERKWDKKCKAPFAEYKPRANPRLA